MRLLTAASVGVLAFLTGESLPEAGRREVIKREPASSGSRARTSLRTEGRPPSGPVLRTTPE